MKELVFDKVCNVGDLDLELRTAGFNISGCSCDGRKTTVHCDDDETKDPTNIVNNHICIPVDTETIMANEKLIIDETRKLAIDKLIKEGKLPSTYK